MVVLPLIVVMAMVVVVVIHSGDSGCVTLTWNIFFTMLNDQTGRKITLSNRR